MLRTRPVRRLSAVAAPVLLALALTACGGSEGSDAPTDASKEDFCEVYDAEPVFDESLRDASPEEQAEAIKDELDKLADQFVEVGTPEDIPDDAREGFELSLEAIVGISQDDIQQGIEDEDEDFLAPDVSADDKVKTDAFDEWARGYCG